ncbi:MAG: metallophosphoesterase [Deltaproteobacteria bacterium]
MRTLVIGDIHGNLRALKQVFERADFDPAGDRLISLGDVYDGHPHSAGCVEELLKVKDFVLCMGNHDMHALNWMREGRVNPSPGEEWDEDDLVSIVESYRRPDGALDEGLIQRHAGFLERALPYYIDAGGRLYVHAGIDWEYPVYAQPDKSVYYYDRKTYAEHAVQHEHRGTKFPFRDVFIGHTKTLEDRPDGKPVRRANLWNVDTGAGSYGKLTIMNVETFEYWQSDWGAELRTGEKELSI